MDFKLIIFSIFVSLYSVVIHAQEGGAKKNEDTLQLNPETEISDSAGGNLTSNGTADELETTEKETNQPNQIPINIAAPPNQQNLYKTDIEKYVSKEAIKAMMAGTEDFITLIQHDLHATDKGVVILLPEWQQAATSPKAINFLRQHMPTQGWTTIVLQPLDKPSGYPSFIENNTVRIEENKTILTAYQEKLIPKMTAVFEEAAKYPGISIVIAEGNNAANLLYLFQQQQLPLPNAFVMLSAHMLTESENIAFASQVAEIDLPILDLYLRKDSKWVDHFITLRKQYATRELKTYYRQRQLNNFSPSYYPDKELARAIKGWLASIGW